MQRYALFKKLADGTPIWVSFEDDLAKATATVVELQGQTGLEHFVQDLREGRQVATSRKNGSSAAPLAQCG
jgi:hypothetical protein